MTLLPKVFIRCNSPDQFLQAEGILRKLGYNIWRQGYNKDILNFPYEIIRGEADGHTFYRPLNKDTIYSYTEVFLAKPKKHNTRKKVLNY